MVQGDDIQVGDVCGSGRRTLHEELWVFDHEGFGGLLSGECSPSEAARIYNVVQDLDDDKLEAFGCWGEPQRRHRRQRRTRRFR